MNNSKKPNESNNKKIQTNFNQKTAINKNIDNNSTSNPTKLFFTKKRKNTPEYAILFKFKFKSHIHFLFIIIIFLDLFSPSYNQISSEIIMKIKGKNNQKILNQDYTESPNEIYINDIHKTANTIIFNGLEHEENTVIIRWNKVMTNCEKMFKDLSNIISINLLNFDSSHVENMAYMFQDCSSLTQLDLSSLDTTRVTNMNSMFRGMYSLKFLYLNNFNTFFVLDMGYMFNGCSSLISLDLSSFNTSNVIKMNNMFKDCSSLIYLNMKSFTQQLSLDYSNIFDNTPNDLIFCISKNTTYISSQLKSKENKNDCSNTCFSENPKININKRKCANNCTSFDDNYKFEFNNICLESCPKDTNMTEDKCETICPADSPYIINNLQECIQKCTLAQNFQNFCSIKNLDNVNEDQLIEDIKNQLTSGNLNNLIENLAKGIQKEYFIRSHNVLFTLSTANNQKKNKDIKKSKIVLEECEDILRNENSMNKNESMIILKAEIFIDGIHIPITYYEIYNSRNRNKLSLESCKDIRITLSLPVSINEDIVYKYNSSSEYYNDLCYTYSLENKTDLVIPDRREEYANNSYALCENICEYNGYIYNTKQSLCSCEIKEDMPKFSEFKFDKSMLNSNFSKVQNFLNFHIMKCISVIFSSNGLEKNIGSYVIVVLTLAYFVLVTTFILYEYDEIYKDINDLFRMKKINRQRPTREEDNKERVINFAIDTNKHKRLIKNNKNIFPENKFLKTFAEISGKSTYLVLKKSENILSSENNNLHVSSLNKLPIKLHKRSLSNRKKNLPKEKDENNTDRNPIIELLRPIYNDYEMNSMSYKDALDKDKRSFIEYYLSLLRKKHILIFSFYTNNDYNSKMVKICIFLLDFGLYYTINSLFFTNATMHQIFIDSGKYNFKYHIPKITFSTLISSVLITVVSVFSSTEHNVIDFKRSRDNVAERATKLIQCMLIKYILFFIFGFEFMIFFWFYLSSFCAIYSHTQIHLLINTIISFSVSLIYPFILCIIPAVLRVLALKYEGPHGERMYKVTQLVEVI